MFTIEEDVIVDIVEAAHLCFSVFLLSEFFIDKQIHFKRAASDQRLASVIGIAATPLVL